MTRAEHLQWCKDRALEYTQRGDIKNSITSMMSDLTKHPETKKHSGIQLGMMMLMAGQIKTAYDAEKFIKGFN